ncbi:MAG: c-type cytochrome [Tagaea sp.]
MRTLVVLALGVMFVATPAAAQGDPVRGAEIFRKCVTCHTVESGGRNRVGPRLHGVFGRRAGAVEGFRYSDVLRASGVVWDDTTLDAYLKDSEGFVPGTRMYGGLTLDQDRADVIAYLRQATR